MTRYEFLKDLRETLANVLSPMQVEENVRYYENYINEQIQMGYTETQVLSELGDPRSIAHNIIDGIEEAAERGGTFEQNNYSSQTYYEDGTSEASRNKKSKLKSYAILAGILFVVCVILILVTKLIIFALPMIIGIAVVVWIINKLNGR